MKIRSLLFRLSLAATILIALALSLAAFGLTAIFNQEIERRAAAELTQIVRAIAAQVRLDPDGTPALDTPLPDPRFDTPYGGLYWQVSTMEGKRSRSRSLWDVDLAVPEDHPDGKRWVTDLDGPNRSRLLSVVQDISVSSPAGDTALQIVAALDRSDLAVSERSLLRLLIPSLAALGLILAIAMSVFIRLALRPFDELRRGLHTIHTGTSRSLAGTFPDEVQPVVDDLNRLIAFQDAAVERARTQAGDLAHALKTPLAVLGAVARQAAGDGRGDLSDPIKEQVLLMQRQVDRVLARARAGIAATLIRKSIAVAPVAQKVVRALERLPDNRDRPGLHWECNAAAGTRFPGEEGDLTEMLGNLLDNARKWAKSRTRLTATGSSGVLRIAIEDDGPGLPADLVPHIVRGQRWDETQPGTGFGLAITQDIAEGYRGRLDLDRSELGGLCATVTIPLPQSA
ncbi:MAG TPA: HAMP domain-containing sensor histidine kinase [Pseudolabrys sp.]|nr:HAMP domain-containing sensor histidine kinase [Pseudolabrys sp.]